MVFLRLWFNLSLHLKSTNPGLPEVEDARKRRAGPGIGLGLPNSIGSVARDICLM
jgi:hypothetical protein